MTHSAHAPRPARPARADHADPPAGAGSAADTVCPCGGQPAGASFAACCARLLKGDATAPDAATLMRSRYTAYTRRDFDYLRRTWHPDHCPADLGQDPDDAAVRWLGLAVKRHTMQEQDRAEVEFIARYKIAGRAYRLHEISRFARIDGRWLYVDGTVSPS